MKAVYIYPEDIGLINEYQHEWVLLCSLFGYDADNPPRALLLTDIKTNKR